MTALQLLPAGLSLLVLSAHFLRGGQVLLVAATLLGLGLLFVKRTWAARAVQLGLALGTLEWVRTLIALVDRRAGIGQPYLRLTAILASVATVAIVAALLLETPRLRRRFRRPPPTR